MNETIAEVFRQARREAEKNVRNNELNTLVYMSGTKNKKQGWRKCWRSTRKTAEWILS